MKKEDFKEFNWAALKLSALLSVVYGVQVIYNVELAYKAFESPIWKFFTSIIAHGGPEHLFNNIFFIALFGSVYELHTSELEFYKAFFLSGVFANLAAFIFFRNSFIVGASGGAMGVLAALTILRPRQVGLVLGIPAPMYLVLIGYVFINFVGLTGATNTAYEAHLLGMVSGAFLGYRKRENPLIPDEDEQEEEEFSNWERRIRRWEQKYMEN